MIEPVNRFIERSLPNIISGLVIFTLTQAVFGLIWLARQEARITANDVQNQAQTIALERIDERGTRALGPIITNQNRVLLTLDQIEKTHATVSTRLNELHLMIASDMKAEARRLQGQIDLVNAMNKKLEDQQIRIIQALDNTYNLINEHLRIDHSQAGPSRTVNPPLKLPPP
jgi:hypothetical protein